MIGWLIEHWRVIRLIGLTMLALVSAPLFQGSSWGRGHDPVRAIDELLAMNCAELEAVYRQGTVCGIPPGRVRGTVFLDPGRRRNARLARATRVVWQGKVIHATGTAAVNRFFGLPLVRAQVCEGASWLDGAPALILDYSRSSIIYANYRDEIRQVGPKVYLGLMYARTAPRPTLRLYFALEVRD